MIPFNKSPVTGAESEYLNAAISNEKLAGDGPFTKKCHAWFEEKLKASRTLLTPSCTHALEMAALLINIQPGDEVIMPSYTFVSTANAFVLRGAKIVFVDIRPDTMNIDESKIESAITGNTKAIVPVHYAGVACEMDTIMTLAKKYNLFVIEDAAQGVMSSYKGRPLGTMGHMGTFSFHETKNYTSGGEGGLLIVNDESLVKRSEIIREKGTNRSLFFRGMVDKYSWVDIGSSFLLSDLQAAYLLAQLESADAINEDRLATWNYYSQELSTLISEGKIEGPAIPDECTHNAHMYYLKVSDLEERTNLISYLKEEGIFAAFHYVPLHSAEAGKAFGRFSGNDEFTTKESERLLRLPLWFGMMDEDKQTVVNAVKRFFA